MEGVASAPVAARGFWSWLLQRVSGLFLVYFLGVHVVAIHLARAWKVDAASVIDRLQGQPLWGLFYLVFIPVALYHGLNGLWALVLDYAPTRGVRQAYLVGLWAVGVAATLFGGWVLNGLLRMG